MKGTLRKQFLQLIETRKDLKLQEKGEEEKKEKQNTEPIGEVKKSPRRGRKKKILDDDDD